MKVIMKTEAGSHMYGLNTEKSDRDYISIYIPELSEIIGIKNPKVINAGKVSKKENGKNDSDAIDHTMYDLKTFAIKALEGNPNIIEILYSNSLLETSDSYKLLVDNRDLFLSKRIVEKYLGFSKHQLNRIGILADGNIEKYKNAIEFLSALPANEPLSKHVNNTMFNNIFSNVRETTSGEVATIGSVDLCLRISNKGLIKILKNLVSDNSNRKELVEENGYDTKAAYHVVRCLTLCMEALENETITLPLTKDKREHLLNIKNGNVCIDEIYKEIKDLISKIEELKITSTLRDEPDSEMINKIVMTIYYQEIYGSDKTLLTKEQLSNL